MWKSLHIKYKVLGLGNKIKKQKNKEIRLKIKSINKYKKKKEIRGILGLGSTILNSIL